MKFLFNIVAIDEENLVPFGPDKTAVNPDFDLTGGKTVLGSGFFNCVPAFGK